MTELEVWLAGEHVATITENRSGISMVYSGNTRPLGAPLVSMSMPVAIQRYGNKIARPFFHGLLPESEARSIIAYDLGIDSSDDMGLLRALGKDCAGALTIQSATDPPPTEVSKVGRRALNEAEIEKLLADLPDHPLGFDAKGIRVSLDGMQPKLPLAQTSDGKWCFPAEGVISTHILKPASRNLPRTVQNEAFCMTVANCAEINSAHTTVEQFGDFVVLVSRRYDRRISPQGSIERVHQEDACQALSILTIPPARKYQQHNPSLSFRAVSNLLDQWGDANAKSDLLKQLTFNMVVGNADYHGKNVSFLHQENHSVRLAPLYDSMCTVYYSGTDDLTHVDTRLGLNVFESTDINNVTMDDIVNEAFGWGMPRSESLPVISELLERLPNAIDLAKDQIVDVPDELVNIVQGRLATAQLEMANLRR
ncbi:MAG: HipA domain-containing protein [Ilumatobacteraceae bacterium]